MAVAQGNAGEVLAGRYALRRRLGKGSFGTVWEAADLESDGVMVAVKLIHPELRGSADVLFRFEREAKALTKLQHPSIGRAMGFSTDPECPFLVMELARGRPLSELHFNRLQSGLRLGIDEVLDWSAEIASGLDHAHGLGFVHRDLKPGNVMVDGAHLKLLDFGIARFILESGDRQTTVGRVLGTLFYMAPEQSRGEPVDHRADIFSFGSLLFTMLTDRRAWARDGSDQPLPVNQLTRDDPSSKNGWLDVFERVQSAARPPPSRYRPEIGPDVDDVICKAMETEREDRFDSAGELHRALNTALAKPRAQSMTYAAPRAPTIDTAPTAVSEPLYEETSPSQAEDGAASTPHIVPPKRRPPLWLAVPLVAGALFALTAIWWESRENPVLKTTVRLPAPTVRQRAEVAQPPTELLEDPPTSGRRAARKRPVARRALRNAPSVPPDAEVPSDPRQRVIEKIIRRAASGSAEVQEVSGMLKELRRLARALPKGPQRTSVNRCLAGANISYDIEEVRGCAEKLLNATRPES